MFKERNHINTDFSKKPIVLTDKFYDIIYKRFDGNMEKVKEYLYPSINHLTYYKSREVLLAGEFIKGVTGKMEIVADGTIDSIMACALLSDALKEYGYEISFNFNMESSFENFRFYLRYAENNNMSTDSKCFFYKKDNDVSLSYFAFSMIWYLFGYEHAARYIDLAAIGTIGSGIRLLGEARALSVFGMKMLNSGNRRPGIQAFLDTIDKRQVNASLIYSILSPSFNMFPDKAVKMLLCQDMERASEYSDFIWERHNEYKKHIQDLEKIFDLKKDDDMHGAVYFLHASSDMSVKDFINASDLINRRMKQPCVFIFDIGKEECLCYIPNEKHFRLLGQIRKDLHIVESLFYERCILISSVNVDSFVYEWMNLSYDERFECRVYDSVIGVSDITEMFYNELRIMEPTGIGNPRASFLLKDVSMKNVIAMGKNCEHFSGTIYDETANVDLISFYQEYPDNLDGYDCVINIGMHEGRNHPKPQAVLIEFEESKDSVIRKLASEITFYETRVKDIPINVLKIPENKILQLKKAGMETVQDLIAFYPRNYLDFRHAKTVEEVYDKETCSMIGTVTFTKQGPKMSYAICMDEKGQKFMACWFNQGYVMKILQKDRKYIFGGQVKKDLSSPRNLTQIYPSHFSHDIRKYKAIIPVYKKISGMSEEYLSECIDEALKIYQNTDFLEKKIVDQFNLLSDYDATLKLHHPSNDIEIRDAQRRKVFNQLFRFNFVLKKQQNMNSKSGYLLKKSSLWNVLLSRLPYNLTNDQMTCLRSIYKDVSSGVSLNALVQGDVGCGKTMIALFSMLLAVENGYQAGIIAPTEVLASQHFEEIKGYLEPLGIKVGYLAGGMKAKEKKEVIKQIFNGEIKIVVGTHAILQDSVQFKNLAMLVIDEQHRFGVEQREKLRKIEPSPHIITMSATPIPRTLSMALYGDDITVYNILEKPAGRQEVETILERNNQAVCEMMLREIRAGHQCYVICPLIAKSDKEKMAGVKSVEEVREQLEKDFSAYPEVRISAITGRMKKDEINNEINKFASLESNVLISTTIVEVGVNIPNATMIVIKSSERFGLAQAHQLRGRVGRGKFKSYCVLQPGKEDLKADILCSSTDGFEIAKQDLKMRGAGDYIGIQQSGTNDDVMLMISEPELYKSISELNNHIYEDKSWFSKYEFLLDEK